MKFGYLRESYYSDVPSFPKNDLTKLASNTNEHYIEEYTPISNQQNLGSCVANATCDALEILLGNERKEVIQLSRLFVYWNARMYTKETNKDQGCFIRNAFDSIKRLGVCKEETWKYDEDNVFAQPPISAYKEGNDNTIEEFYRINSTDQTRINEIKLAILADHPVVFGTAVSEDFIYNTNPNKVWSKPDKIYGYHAMIIVGFKDDNFYIRNSWSQNWGDNGHCWMDKNYLTWSNTTDLYVPTLVPNLVF